MDRGTAAWWRLWGEFQPQHQRSIGISLKRIKSPLDRVGRFFLYLLRMGRFTRGCSQILKICKQETGKERKRKLSTFSFFGTILFLIFYLLILSPHTLTSLSPKWLIPSNHYNSNNNRNFKKSYVCVWCGVCVGACVRACVRWQLSKVSGLLLPWVSGLELISLRFCSRHSCQP